MKKAIALVAVVICAGGLFNQPVLAQQANPPADGPRATQREERLPDRQPDSSSIVSRMMAFDQNRDGKLMREEITDPRLLRLFDLADTNKDGVVTRQELTALAARIDKQEGPAGEFGPGPGGPGGFGPPGFGPGGPGPRGLGPPPQPGQVLPPMIRQLLKVTPDQQKQLDALQHEVDQKLATILTDEQKQQLHRLRSRGPDRFRPMAAPGPLDGPPAGSDGGPPPPPPGDLPGGPHE